MSTAALVQPQSPSRATQSNWRFSRAGWARLRRTLTIGVFVVATVTGIGVGVRATDVSPVAPTLAGPPPPDQAVPAPQTPVIPAGPGTPDRGNGRRGGNTAGQGGHR
jgi:hypothetical protein